MTYPNKDIWLYTGYTLGDILTTYKNNFDVTRLHCIESVDYLIDGQFDISQRDLRLKFRGSANQRIWTKEDIKKGLEY